jgi:hypothetical protein
MDLIRAILLKVEENPHGFMPSKLEVDGYTKEEIGYHVYLMGQAGLAEVLTSRRDMAESPSAVLKNLTWQGHEFLGASRNQTIWEQAKAILPKAGDGSFGLWQSVLTDLVKKSLGL